MRKIRRHLGNRRLSRISFKKVETQENLCEERRSQHFLFTEWFVNRNRGKNFFPPNMYGIILIINESAYNTTHDMFVIIITPQEAEIFCLFLKDRQT